MLTVGMNMSTTSPITLPTTSGSTWPAMAEERRDCIQSGNFRDAEVWGGRRREARWLSTRVTRNKGRSPRVVIESYGPQVVFRAST